MKLRMKLRMIRRMRRRGAFGGHAATEASAQVSLVVAPTEARPSTGADALGTLRIGRRRRPGDERAGRRFGTGDHQSRRGVMGRQVRQVMRAELGRDVALEGSGVLG